MTQKLSSTIDGLTGLRGVAAWWVVLFHVRTVIIPLFLNADMVSALVQSWQRILHVNIRPLFYGWMGVQVFFVLSGFLLFLPFARVLLGQREKINLLEYFKRRFKRILPAYYFQLVILAVLSFFGLYQSTTWTNWIMHGLMIHNFSSVYNWELNGVSWTVPVEFDFYLLLPLLFLFIRKSGIYNFVLAALGGAIIYKMMVFSYAIDKEVIYKVWLFGQLPGRIDLFAFGMLGAFIYEKYNQQIQQFKYKNYLEFGLLAGGVFAVWLLIKFLMSMEGKFWLGHPSLFFYDSLLGVAILLIVLGITIQGKLTKILFANRLVVYLGEISYSTYLWHMPLLLFVFQNPQIKKYIQANPNENLLLVLLFAIGLVLFASILSYRYVELPFLRKK